MSLAEQIAALSQDIRRIDGNHDMGAGALAEALVEAGWVNRASLATQLNAEADLATTIGRALAFRRAARIVKDGAR